MVTGSLDYTIDVLPDRPPTVQFTKPGRDQKVLSVDEVYTEARAEDDYGVAKLELVYSVNGGPEKTVPLHDGTRAIRDISAGLHVHARGLKLEPGDVVSYYARATDNNARERRAEGVDRHLLPAGAPVRRRTIARARAAVAAAAAAVDSSQDDAGQLSQKQRDIIAAHVQDGARQRGDRQEDARARISRRCVCRSSGCASRPTSSARRLVERGIAASDSNWKKIATILPTAAAAMDTAEKQLAAGIADGGARSRSSARCSSCSAPKRCSARSRCRWGSRAAAVVAAAARKPTPRTSPTSSSCRRSKLRNQYETRAARPGQQQQQQQQQADNQVDEAAEKLKQLAARQQQENERARRKADSLGQMGASGAQGGQGQRRWRSRRKTRRASSSVSRASSSRSRWRTPRGACRKRPTRCAARPRTANRAATLRQARRSWRKRAGCSIRRRTAVGSRDVNDAMRAAQQLADQEKKVQSDAQTGWVSRRRRAIRQASRSCSSPSRSRKARWPMQVKDLKQQLDRMALDTRRDQQATSRALEQAADTLRGRKLEERLRATGQNVAQRAAGLARPAGAADQQRHQRSRAAAAAGAERGAGGCGSAPAVAVGGQGARSGAWPRVDG